MEKVVLNILLQHRLELRLNSGAISLFSTITDAFIQGVRDNI